MVDKPKDYKMERTSRVWVRYPKEDRLNIGQLEIMKVKTPRGDFPLTELVIIS